MRSRFIAALGAAVVVLSGSAFAADKPPFKKGDKIQTLSALHPDMKQRLIYAINYQLPGFIPACTELTVVKASGSELVFTYGDVDFRFANDGFTKNSGVPFSKVVETYFGPKCDQDKIKSLSKLDQDGIASGRPQIGMSKEGVLIAMGRPPYHVNPTLDIGEWMYWRNRFTRTVVTFNSQGKVSGIR